MGERPTVYRHHGPIWTGPQQFAARRLLDELALELGQRVRVSMVTQSQGNGWTNVESLFPEYWAGLRAGEQMTLGGIDGG